MIFHYKKTKTLRLLNCFLFSIISVSNICFLKGQNTEIGNVELKSVVVFVKFNDSPGNFKSLNYYKGVFENDALSVKNYYNWISHNRINLRTNYINNSNNTNVNTLFINHNIKYFLPYDINTNPIGYTNKDRWNELYNEINNYVSQYITPEWINSNTGALDNLTIIYDIDRETTYSAPQISNPYWPVSIRGRLNFTTGNFDYDILTHEYGHTISRLFGNNGPASDLYFKKEVGNYDVMGEYFGLPSSMSSYTMMKYMNFFNEIPEISKPGYYKLKQLHYNNTYNACKIRSFNPSEYFIIEFRKKGASGTFDGSLAGDGLVIYKVNLSKSGVSGHELYLYRPNGDEHYNQGDYSNAYFSLESNRTSFNQNTTLKPVLFNGDLANFSITEIGSANGNEISFRFDIIPCENYTSDEIYYGTNDPIPYLSAARNLVKFDGTFNIASGQSKRIVSDKVIILKPGFCALKGSNVRMELTECDVSTNFTIIPSIQSTSNLRRDVSENSTQGNLESESKSQVIQAYPNPAKEYISFNIPLNNITVFNINGKIIETIDSASSLNSSKYDSGTYLIKADEGYTKIIIE